jgi:hypothetical protein
MKMGESKIISGWRDEGRIETAREWLTRVLETNRGALPTELTDRIQSETNLVVAVACQGRQRRRQWMRQHGEVGTRVGGKV